MYFFTRDFFFVSFLFQNLRVQNFPTWKMRKKNREFPLVSTLNQEEILHFRETWIIIRGFRFLRSPGMRSLSDFNSISIQPTIRLHNNTVSMNLKKKKREKERETTTISLYNKKNNF